MPPSVNFDTYSVLDAAFSVLRTKGISRLSARTIAAELGSSTQPVYSAYSSMDDLRKAVIEKAASFAIRSLLEENPGENPFLAIGMNYFRFAHAEPQIFRLVFLSPKNDSVNAGTFFSADLVERMKMDPDLSGLDNDALVQLLADMWIYIHGLVSLSHSGSYSSAEQDIREQLQRIGGILITNAVTRCSTNPHDIQKKE